MNLNTEICYRALLSHDRRFDGTFFIGVRSTHIYCRNVCTAKIPMLKNCTFFASAAAAEQAGYRPCLRCRPELAPGMAKIDSVGRLAQTIARHIEDGALGETTVAGLADTVGISERHLRRVVESEFGVSPLELAQTQRLLLAKQLLTDTKLPITEIAFASGFSSLRRFNSIFKERYSLNPSQLRNGKRTQSTDDAIECVLGYRPPLDWQSLMDFISARAVAGVECVTSDTYRRTAEIGKHRGWFEVIVDETRHKVTVRVAPSLSRTVLPLLARIRRLFDLNADPEAIALHLGVLAAERPGLRIPGAFDGFEISVRAILGQQVSVRGATTVMARFVSTYGEPAETPFEEIRYYSPKAAKIAKLTATELARAIGIPQARALAIVELAKAVDNKKISLNHATDIEATLEELKALPGIGDWTAQYIAMRALNWPDAFLHGDLGIKKAMNETNPARILDRVEQWRPWRAYAAMHLWKSLDDEANGNENRDKNRNKNEMKMEMKMEMEMEMDLELGDK